MSVKTFEIHELPSNAKKEQTFRCFVKAPNVLSALESVYGKNKVKFQQRAQYGNTYFVVYKPFLTVCALDHAKRAKKHNEDKLKEKAKKEESQKKQEEADKLIERADELISESERLRENLNKCPTSMSI